jgi:hypothetical protein
MSECEDKIRLIALLFDNIICGIYTGFSSKCIIFIILSEFEVLESLNLRVSIYEIGRVVFFNIKLNRSLLFRVSV